MCQSPGANPSPSSSPSPNPIRNPTAREERVHRDLNRQAVVQDLSRRLAYGDLAARIQAAREVRKLARASIKARSAFAVASIVQPLVSMLPSPEYQAKEVALLALLNLAARNESNKISIAKFGAVHPLVELLKSESSRLRELATAAILTLSGPDCNKSIIAASGAARLLVQILVSGSIQGRVDAVTALYNLSTCQESLEPSLAAESVPQLLTLLKDCKKYSKFAEKATALLERLSDSEEGRTAISEFDGGILTLVETVEDGSVLSVEYAAGALLTLCKSCREKYRELILNEGAIPGLLILTVYGTEGAQKKARELLELLRDDSMPKRVTSEVLETIVYDIASRVDGPDKAAETAGRLLKDMARRNMELSINQLQVRTTSSTPNLPLT